VIVRHADPASRDRHEELGFFDGWGSVTAALAELVESDARPRDADPSGLSAG